MQYPTDDTDAGWLNWVNKHYPYDGRPASRYTDLDKLRSVRDRHLAAQLGRLHQHMTDNEESINEHYRSEEQHGRKVRRTAREKLARDCLDGKRGEAMRVLAAGILGAVQPEYQPAKILIDFERHYHWQAAKERGEMVPLTLEPIDSVIARMRAQKTADELDDIITGG